MKAFFIRKDIVAGMSGPGALTGGHVAPGRVVWFLAILFLLTRLVLVFFFPDTVCDTRDQQFGATAVELVHNTRMSPFDLTSDVCIGRPFFSFLLTPFYILFGPSIIWNKVLSLLLSVTLLVMWHRFFRKYFSDQLAFIFGIFFIFSPTILTGSNLVLWPSRLQQGGLFVIGSMTLFFDILFNERRDLLRPMFLGLICGLGVWFDYFFVLFLLPILFVWFLKEKKLFRQRGFIVFILSFSCGILPWVLFSLRPESMNDYVSEMFKPAAVGNAFQRLMDILTVHFPYMFFYQGAPDGIKGVYYGVFLGSLIAAIYIYRKCFYEMIRGRLFCPGKPLPEVRRNIVFIFLLACMTLYILYSSFSALRLRPRYLELLYPVIFFFMAVVFSSTRIRRRFFYFFLLPCLVVLTAGDLMARGPYFDPGKVWDYPGSYNYKYFGKALFDRNYSLDDMRRFLNGDKGRTVGIINGFLEEHAGRNSPAAYASMMEAGLLSQDIQISIRQKFPDYVYLYVRKHASEGDAVMDAIVHNFLVGHAAPHALAQGAWVKFMHDPDFSARLDEGEKQIVYQCWGVIQGICYTQVRAGFDPSRGVMAPYLRYFWEGFGYGYVTRIKFDKDIPVSKHNIRAIFNDFAMLLAGDLKGIPDAYKGFVYYGAVQNPMRFDIYQLSLQFYMPFLDAQPLIAFIDRNVEPFFRSYIYAGLGKGLGVRVCAREVLLGSASPFLKQLDPAYEPSFFSGLDEGLVCTVRDKE